MHKRPDCGAIVINKQNLCNLIEHQWSMLWIMPTHWVGATSNWMLKSIENFEMIWFCFHFQQNENKKSSYYCSLKNHFKIPFKPKYFKSKIQLETSHILKVWMRFPFMVNLVLNNENKFFEYAHKLHGVTWFPDACNPELVFGSISFIMPPHNYKRFMCTRRDINIYRQCVLHYLSKSQQFAHSTCKEWMLSECSVCVIDQS